MVVVQGAVTHAVHWLRPLPTAEHNRCLAGHGQHADRCHVLRHVCRSRHYANTILRHFEETLPRKGTVQQVRFNLFFPYLRSYYGSTLRQI